MPEAKWPAPKRRSPASRPGKAGAAARDRRGPKPVAKPSSAKASRRSAPAGDHAVHTLQEHLVEPLKRLFVESIPAGRRAEQRLGFTARRAAVFAAVVCALTLTIAGPVRTYFAQRTEIEQLAATEAALRHQITDLEQRKNKLADPAYIAAQARERLGFVMPGEIPFQVQLPRRETVPSRPGAEAGKPTGNDPWYTLLWHTIADDPHLPPPSEAEPSDG